MVRASLAEPGHGPARPDRNEGFRGLLLQGLHPRLCTHAGGCRRPGRTNEPNRQGPPGRPGRDRPVLFDKGHRSGVMLRFAQHPRWRMLQCTGEGLGRGRHSLQHSDDLQRRLVQERPTGVREGANRRGLQRAERRDDWPRSWTPTRARDTWGNSRSDSTRTSSNR